MMDDDCDIEGFLLEERSIFDKRGLLMDTHDYPWRLAASLGISLNITSIAAGIQIELRQVEFQGKAEEKIKRRDVVVVDFDDVKAEMTKNTNYIRELTIRRINAFYDVILKQRGEL